MNIGYESIALIMRFVFLLIVALIFLRTLFMTLKDTRNASKIRSQQQETADIAFLEVRIPHKFKRKYPMGIEGIVGSGHAADVCIEKAGLEKQHFQYKIEDGCMHITMLDGAGIFLTNGEKVENGAVIHSQDVFLTEHAQFLFMVRRAPAMPLSPLLKKAYGKEIQRIVKRKGGDA